MISPYCWDNFRPPSFFKKDIASDAFRRSLRDFHPLIYTSIVIPKNECLFGSSLASPWSFSFPLIFPLAIPSLSSISASPFCPSSPHLSLFLLGYSSTSISLRSISSPESYLLLFCSSLLFFFLSPALKEAECFFRIAVDISRSSCIHLSPTFTLLFFYCPSSVRLIPFLLPSSFFYPLPFWTCSPQSVQNELPMSLCFFGVCPLSNCLSRKTKFLSSTFCLLVASFLIYPKLIYAFFITQLPTSIHNESPFHLSLPSGFSLRVFLLFLFSIFFRALFVLEDAPGLLLFLALFLFIGALPNGIPVLAPLPLCRLDAPLPPVSFSLYPVTLLKHHILDQFERLSPLLFFFSKPDNGFSFLSNRSPSSILIFF